MPFQAVSSSLITCRHQLQRDDQTLLFHQLSVMSTATYKIVGIDFSTCCRTVSATLEELGQTYEFQVVDMATIKSADYLAKLQPFGQIPVLIDGDFQLYESRAIIRYLADKHKADLLYPSSDLQKRALVEQWLSVNQSNASPVTDIVAEFKFKVYRGQDPDRSKIPELRAKLDTFLAILDKQLDTNAYIAGSDFTLADISFYAYNHELLLLPDFKDSFASFKNVTRWWTDISNRQSWKKATKQI